ILDFTEPVPKMCVANGGHPPLAVVRSGEAELQPPTGGLLGVVPGAIFDELSVARDPGDLIGCYTDGVREARSHGQEFGDVRLVETLRSLHSAAAQEA